MNNISKFAYCYGCGVCASACPKQCISMHINTDGFYKPEVDEKTCVDCGLCTAVCAFNADKVVQDEKFELRSYAIWSNNPIIRTRCTSGGVGFEIGKFLIRKGYKVIACKYNPESKHAEHYLAETEEELEKSIGSKYIQSDSIPGFSQIKKGYKYFITGTPCQIDSIRRWMLKRKMSDDVFLLDFFCHGVPSYLLWQSYINELEKKIGIVNDIEWRNKEKGWHDSWVMRVKDKYSSWFSKGDLFYQMFLGDRCLGRQCYHNCKYKYNHSAADIRIGDLWGRVYKDDEEGVNGVICLTQKGTDLLEDMKDIFHIEMSTLEIVTESQMKRCAPKPISNNYVMRSLKERKPLAEINTIAGRIELIERIPQKIMYYINRLPSKIMEVTGLKTKPQK